ncbi:hypothetical protein AG1IA_09798 [Rhizoctonia solani AG-1 IA]|uniref:Chitin deacetylase n=1 Tax=Thanatephorus cucumeris (strain AG1-IA) TaxID=983506 RepID=L8WHH1_THACA|nr:hypothetical protein AG1IA_09798 [Rhizoctonia solani AG-1 IA]
MPACMRPPFGSYNDNVQNVAGVRGQKIVNWDFDSRDSAGTMNNSMLNAVFSHLVITGASAAESNGLYDQIISQRPSTILALNHETYEVLIRYFCRYEVLPYAIQKLQAAGYRYGWHYRLVTVAECLGEQPYQSVGSPQTPDNPICLELTIENIQPMLWFGTPVCVICGLCMRYKWGSPWPVAGGPRVLASEDGLNHYARYPIPRLSYGMTPGELTSALSQASYAMPPHPAVRMFTTSGECYRW